MNSALSPLPHHDRSEASSEPDHPSERGLPGEAWPPGEPVTGGRWRRTIPRGEQGALPAVTWEETPDLGARVRRGVHVPALVAVLLFIVALVVTAVLMLRALTGSHDEQAVGHAAGSLAPDDASTGDTGAAQGGPGEDRGVAGAAGGDVGLLYIHLVGEVAEPGVVELAAGSRVLDAIAAAGGATPAADLSTVNLARELSDGEQIVVYNAEAVAAGAVPGPRAPGPGDAPGTGGGSGVINVNTADASTLQQLSGVGPALAERIVSWRDEHGRFASVDDLLSVSGIGAKKLAGFREQAGV